MERTMVRKTRPDGNIVSGKPIDYGFSVREGDCITKAYIVQGLDLVIEQKSGKSESAYLAHYSNPGTNFFVGLMKFLYVNQVPLPEVKAPDVSYNEEFDHDAMLAARSMAFEKFPVSYVYYYSTKGEEPPTATLEPVYEESKPSELRVSLSSGGVITIPPETARKLIEFIPQMYPHNSSFHTAYVEFLAEAGKHPEQIRGAFERTEAKKLERKN